MSDDELDDAVPMTPAEKAVAFFKGEEPTKLQPREITPEMVARLYENLEEEKHLKNLIEMDKKDIKELAKDQETLTIGKYVVMLTKKKGRRTVQWDKLARAMIGKLTDEDLEKYTDESDGSVSLSIRKLG